MKRYFALAYKSDPKSVSALCEKRNDLDDGEVEFTCISGAWDGVLTADRNRFVLKMPPEDAWFTCRVIWEGDHLPGRDYNESIEAINAELRK